jgi:hypothetical protein
MLVARLLNERHHPPIGYVAFLVASDFKLWMTVSLRDCACWKFSQQPTDLSVVEPPETGGTVVSPPV